MISETQFKNLYDLQQYFCNETVCREYLERFRWNGSPACPFCGSLNPYKLGDGKTYKCSTRECGKKFTATVGTIFENTKIPLTKWFVAMYLITAHKKGISSLQLGRDIGVTQKTAWFINHRIREMLIDKAPELLSNIVELDESYVGGKDRFKHNSKRTGGTQGRSTKNKTVMFGLLERKGKVVAFKIPNAQRNTLIPLIENAVAVGSTVVTDEHYAYRGISDDYNHLSINHGEDIYVNGIAHTNSIEGYWSLFKRGVVGIYHSVSEKHIDRYLVEFSGRYNTRWTSEAERFNFVLSQCEGRLKYQDLIKK